MLAAGLWLAGPPAPLAAAPVPPAVEASRAPACLISPKSVKPGETLRVLAAFESDPRDLRISVSGPAGPLVPLRTEQGGGPPFWRAALFRVPGRGRYAVAVVADGRPAGAAEVEVTSAATAARPAGRVWESVRGWTRADENLYSAWLEALFLGTDERSSWPALHDAVDDPERNLLFDHLGLGEDDPGGPNRLEMTPDCADNPFYLRAYFAWKTGLPFGFSDSSWGTLGAPPKPLRWRTNETMGGGGNPAGAFARMLLVVKDAVHAGNGRMEFKEDRSDYYPVPLTRKDLRPGVVFADPYGHTLTIVRWVAQTAGTPGLLLAVDAQPDGTIAVKRFWEGNFCFNTREVVGEPGFKAFRPVVCTPGGGLRLLSNEEIAASPDYGNFSLEQRKMSSEDFYAAMEKLINPEPLDAESAFEDLFRALHEQLIARIVSVAVGEKYMAAHPGSVIPMPAGGAAVFQTTGQWEDFSTPNRDLRLLIAIDTVLGFPDKVARNPAAYGLPAGPKAEKARTELLALAKKRAAELTITYTRSDGKAQVLTLAQVFERKEAFEMGYNPNDCIETRWGAPAGSEEAAACRRRAPAAQVERMKAMRQWFRARLHPPT